MKTRALFAAALLTAVSLPVRTTSPLASAEVIGKITYLEGTVEIVRDGESPSRCEALRGTRHSRISTS